MTQRIRVIDVSAGGWHRRPDPDDAWDAGRKFETHNIQGLILVESERAWHEFTTELEFKVGDDAWLVWVIYSTGSTFGTAEGCITYCDVFKDQEEAWELYRRIDNGQHVDEYTIRYEVAGVAKDLHTGWVGYFESLQSVHCEKLGVYPEGYSDY